MAILKLNNISKRFTGNREAVLKNFSIEVAHGEVLAILGESGCGKTTLLRVIAGFETPDSGEVWLNGRVVSSDSVFQEPERRGVGIVFQDYALFPHKTVLENIVFGLFRLPRQQQLEKARAMMELTGLTGLQDRYPHQVSGGQKQRVALARALAPEPGIILFDEPFSNVDIPLRRQIRNDIQKILQKTGVTALFVTHDIRDVMSLANRLVVMKDGQIIQCASPEKIAEAPVNEYTASFFY
jgi:iron(III) transport system ATP-binding protein